MAKKLPPVHPGEILREEFLVPLKLTPYAVAAALHVPRTRIERIAREEKPVTADTALRLGKFFETGAAFWMNMQARFDLETAEDVLAPEISKIEAYEAVGEPSGREHRSSREDRPIINQELLDLARWFSSTVEKPGPGGSGRCKIAT